MYVIRRWIGLLNRWFAIISVTVVDSTGRRVIKLYDYELNDYLSNRNNILTSDEYMYVCNTCPQINHVKYDPFDNLFKVWSEENYFEFIVKEK